MIHLSDELLERALAEIRQEELNNLPSDEELKINTAFQNDLIEKSFI